LARWVFQFAPGILICGVVVISQPPSGWPALAPALLLYFGVLVGFAVVVARHRTINVSLRSTDGVAFSTQNVPGAMVYLEPYEVSGVAFARALSFVIVADDSGVGYFTRGKNPVRFVSIPWVEIASVEEFGGELCITLTDGSLLLHVPGGMLPVGVKRVRELARQMAALQPARQL